MANGFLNKNGNRPLAFLLYLLSAGFCWTGLMLAEAQTADRANPDRKAQTNESRGIKTFDVNCEYGTLAFRGRVERTETGDKYQFRVQLAAVFFPGETLNGYTMTNRTKEADLKTCELVATQKVADKQPYRLLEREARPIAVRLTEYGQVGVLPELVFSLTKSIANSADHVGLAVIGSGLVWPVPIELK